MDLCREVNDKSISVYNEISNLCQTIVGKYDIEERRKKNLVKNLRSNAFNKLLFYKNIIQNKEDIDDDPNFIITDIFFKIHCLATKNQYNSNNRTKQHTFKLLEDMHEALQSNPNLTAVLQLLLLLADSRNKDEDEEEPSIGLDMRKLSKRNFLDPPLGILAVPPDSLFDYLQTVDDFYEKKLKKINVVYEFEPGTGLSEYFSFMSKRTDNLYNNEVIEEDSNNIVWRFPPSNINLQIPNSITSAHADEGYFTPDIDHAWEVEVATTKLDYWNDSLLEPSTSLLTWETLGSSYTQPEKTYITQIKDGIFHFVRSLKQFPNNDDIQVQSIDISKEVFNRDILYLLIAVESSTFFYNQESNSFMMKPGVFINGLSPNLLNSYCEEAIRCGNSYLKLNNLVKEEIQNSAKSKQSLIFMALCRCVQRYLQCYVGTILKIPSSEGLVKMNHWIVALRTQLEFLVEICCKNSSEESGKLPHGGALLLYIYEKVSEVVRQDLGYILHFILYSCSVVYFRILEKWIFEGVCDDPHGEFFIEAKPTNEVTYDRLFWTRSCVLNRMRVPRFLKDLENDLFVCGKSIRLLKLCNVKDPFLQFLKQGYPGVKCCLGQEEIDHVYTDCANFTTDCVNKCGPRPRVLFSLSDKEQEEYLISVAKQREKTIETLQRMKIENQRIKNAGKLEIFEELKRGMEEERARKIQARQSQLVEDKKLLEIAEEIDEIEKIQRAEERRKIEKLYNQLTINTENRQLKAEWKLKRLQLNELRLEFLKNEQSQIEKEISKNEVGDVCDKIEIIGVTASSVLVEESNDSLNKPESIVDNLINEDKNSAVTQPNKPKIVSEMEKINRVCTAKINTQEEFHSPLQLNLTTQKSPSIICEKMSLKETRIQKELKELEAAMVHADDARERAFKNRERTYGGDYNIITGEILKPSGLEHEVERVSKEVQEGELSENICDATLKSKYLEDLVNDECIDMKSIDLAVDDSISLSPHVITQKIFDRPEETIQNKNVDHSTTNLPETKADFSTNSNEYTTIFNSVDNIIYDEEKRKINMKQVDITKIYDCLQKSVLYPLQSQLKLANDALLRMFLNEHNLIAHLNCLRKHFFFLDSDYGSNLTKNVFSEIQSVRHPSFLLNHLRLNSLLRTAVSNDSDQDLAERLSFVVNSVPATFSLTDPNTLNCLSLTYKVHWPLNIVLTSQAMSKYDQVFKFLMQLRRATWTLEQDIYLLKIEFSTKSNQYRQIHLFRHIMAQFLQALQNYILTIVMEPSWMDLQKQLDKTSTFQELYHTHVNYIKNIIFRCLLNKRSKTINKHLLDLFRIILTFHENLRSDDWFKGPDGEIQHPAFPRLCHQFRQFVELSRFLCSYLKRLVASGYQPHLDHLLTFLSCNNFYESKAIR